MPLLTGAFFPSALRGSVEERKEAQWHAWFTWEEELMKEKIWNTL